VFNVQIDETIYDLSFGWLGFFAVMGTMFSVIIRGDLPNFLGSIVFNAFYLPFVHFSGKVDEPHDWLNKGAVTDAIKIIHRRRIPG
jgi:hypothetical protein